MPNTLKGNYQESIDFLKKFHPETPWVLTAIRPDRKGVETKTFIKGQESKARVWIENRNGHSNLYFHVNNVKNPLNKKASLKDIKSMGYLHVDIDPRTGYDLEAEREYILDYLTDKLPSDIPEPSCIVFSGGGYQAFWKLDKPFEINGDLALAEKAATYNKVLENLFEADNCHNVDRIMRLPGTINIPDARKIKKGRTPELAKVIYFRDYKYNLEDFPKLVSKQETSNLIKKSIDLNSIQPQKISNLNELDQWDVSDRIKVIINNGQHYEMPKEGDNSRSAWLYDVCCNLIRHHVPDEVILGVITDSAWSISESVLDKGSKAHTYAVRQIESAKQEVGPLKRKIVLQEGDLSGILDEAESALIEHDMGVFQRGKCLVRTMRINQSKRHDGIKRDETSSIIEDVDSKWLMEQMGRSAQWVRYKKQNDVPVEVKTDPQEKYARHLLSRCGEWGFDVLNGVITSPTLRKDGSILQGEGYDETTGLKYEALGVEFPIIPEHPSKEDAQKALNEISEIFAEFPFVTEASRSVALVAILTGLVRRSLKTAPLFAIDAPTPGTGKSLLADLIAYIVTGKSPSMITQGKNPEEDEKRLSSMLKAGDSVIVIDNCEQPIEGDFLCAMLTSEVVKSRILGKSETAEFASSALVMATGNNLVPSSDMARRTLVCRLDANNERPDKRTFKADVRKLVKDNRPKLVVAGLTILRAYLNAGKPNKLSPIGSFESWNWVREALVWLGCEDPEKTRDQFMLEDPRQQLWGNILKLWHDRFGENPIYLREIGNFDNINAPQECQQLSADLMDFAGVRDFNTHAISSKMKGMTGRIVDGKKLCKIPNKRLTQWYVADVHGKKKA